MAKKEKVFEVPVGIEWLMYVKAGTKEEAADRALAFLKAREKSVSDSLIPRDSRINRVYDKRIKRKPEMDR